MVALIEIRKLLQDALKAHSEMLRHLNGAFSRIAAWRKQHGARGGGAIVVGDSLDQAASESIGASVSAAKDACMRAKSVYTSLIAQYPGLKNNKA